MAKHGKKRPPTFRPVPNPTPSTSEAQPSASGSAAPSTVKMFSVHISESQGIKKRRLNYKTVVVEPRHTASQPPGHPEQPEGTSNVEGVPPSQSPPDASGSADYDPPGILPESLRGPALSNAETEQTVKPKRARNNQTTKVRHAMSPAVLPVLE